MWFQLKIDNCPVEGVEALSAQLEELGALSIMLTDKNDDPVLEPEPGSTPLWPEIMIQALFAEAIEAEKTKNFLALSQPHLYCIIEHIPDQDWERAWMDDFKPQQFGSKLWVCPTWLTPPEPDAVNLFLDPGLAFGTGTHSTTALCLTWLEQASLNNKSVIDYGCGSGILSIAALKLGAKCVEAVDIDDQALQATQNNAKLNQIEEDKLRIEKPEALENPVDIIIANILLAPLINLKQRFNTLLNEEGLLVVSGILSNQVPLLVEAYKNTFSLFKSKDLNEWSLLIFQHKGAQQ